MQLWRHESGFNSSATRFSTLTTGSDKTGHWTEFRSLNMGLKLVIKLTRYEPSWYATLSTIKLLRTTQAIQKKRCKRKKHSVVVSIYRG